MNSVNCRTAPATARSYRSPQPRANLAVGILILFGIVAIVTALSTMAEINLLQRAVEGKYITEAEGLANDSRQQFVRVIYMGVYATSVIAFIAWMYRASQNLAPLGGYARRYQKYTPVHTIFWWFVPVAHMWQPYRVIKGIWNESHGIAEDASSRLLMTWWTFWLVSNALGWVTWWTMFFDPTYGNAESLINTGYRTIASIGCLLVAGGLAISIILKVTDAQERRSRERIATNQINGGTTMHLSASVLIGCLSLALAFSACASVTDQSDGWRPSRSASSQQPAPSSYYLIEYSVEQGFYSAHSVSGPKDRCERAAGESQGAHPDSRFVCQENVSGGFDDRYGTGRRIGDRYFVVGVTRKGKTKGALVTKEDVEAVIGLAECMWDAPELMTQLQFTDDQNVDDTVRRLLGRVPFQPNLPRDSRLTRKMFC